MEKIPWTSIAGILFLCLSIADGYSKYGRSCSDIGCRSNEECVMAEDPCPLYRSSSTECGKYPKCSVKNGGGASCRTTQCPLGKYCKTVDGQPTCVDTSSQLAPAARRPGGRRKIIVTTPPPVPPRSSSFGFDGRRYPGNSRNTIGGGGIGGNSDGNNGNRGSSSIWNGWGGRGGSGGKSGGTKQTDNHSNDRGNYYKTHISSDSRGNKVWTFSG